MQAIRCGCGATCKGHAGLVQHQKRSGCTRAGEGNCREVLSGQVYQQQASNQPAASHPTADRQNREQVPIDSHASPHHEQDQQPVPDSGGRGVPNHLGKRWFALNQQNTEARQQQPRVVNCNKTTDCTRLIASEEVRDITSVMLNLHKAVRLKLLKHYPRGRLPYFTYQDFLCYVQPEQVCWALLAAVAVSSYAV